MEYLRGFGYREMVRLYSLDIHVVTCSTWDEVEKYTTSTVEDHIEAYQQRKYGRGLGSDRNSSDGYTSDETLMDSSSSDSGGSKWLKRLQLRTKRPEARRPARTVGDHHSRSSRGYQGSSSGKGSTGKRRGNQRSNDDSSNKRAKVTTRSQRAETHDDRQRATAGEANPRTPMRGQTETGTDKN